MGAEFEKDLTKSSTLEYVRAISSTGESILISKADLAKVLTELINEATSTKKGLQSAEDKKQCLRYYLVSGQPLIKLTQFTSNWQRSNAIIQGGIDDSVVDIIISAYRQNGNTKTTIVGKHSSIQFYTKDTNVYMFVNITTAAPNSLAIASQHGVEFISHGVAPDATYTKVEY